MKVTIKKLEKSEVEITITVPFADYEKGEKKALESLWKEVIVSIFPNTQIRPWIEAKSRPF